MHFTLLLIVCAIGLKEAFSDPSTPQNVLVIIADDLGLELNSYGNDVIKTPHISSLSARGVTFKNAFATVSSCSPSRSTILTGLPQHQNGKFYQLFLVLL